MKKALAIIFGVLLLDQCIKIYIKTHLYLGETFRISGQWFYLHFVENPGMAFGLQLGGNYGKVLLSIFRLAAVAGIGYYMWRLFRKQVRPLLLVCVALIFAGAMGNILDSIFYAKFFNTSDQWDQNVAEFMPAAGGYGGWLHGQVVDMFYFPVLEGHWPSWLPDQMNTSYPDWFPRAGEDFLFFRPVFNIADASISVGVFLLIVFQRRLFGRQEVLSDRKVMATNIFFGFVAFLISLFLLLTLTGLFASEHPIAPMSRVFLLIASLGIGYGFFEFLKRYPRFIPEPGNVVDAKIKVDIPEPSAPSEKQEGADSTEAK